MRLARTTDDGGDMRLHQAMLAREVANVSFDEMLASVRSDERGVYRLRVCVAELRPRLRRKRPVPPALVRRRYSATPLLGPGDLPVRLSDLRALRRRHPVAFMRLTQREPVRLSHDAPGVRSRDLRSRLRRARPTSVPGGIRGRPNVVAEALVVEEEQQVLPLTIQHHVTRRNWLILHEPEVLLSALVPVVLQEAIAVLVAAQMTSVGLPPPLEASRAADVEATV